MELPESRQRVVAQEDRRHREAPAPKIRVVRDYGRFDRREAAQFYPDIRGAETKPPEPAH